MATAELQTQRSGRCPSSGVRIVLLGGRNSGKSWAGNAIIGKEEFITRERTTCLKKQATVLGRRVVVTDAPGWWCDFSVSDTPELVKQEIVRAVMLCHPGPHVLFLVIKTASVFTEKRRRAAQEHLELLGKAAWRHTVVLFTHGGHLTNSAVEEHIRREGNGLRWILQKCGNRYGALDIRHAHNFSKVAELLAKIESLLAENGGRHFQMEEDILQQVEHRRSNVMLRAQRRLVTMKSRPRFTNEDGHHLTDLRLVLLGASGSGKSSVGNTILTTGKTFDVKMRTARCVSRTGTYRSETEVTLVDTPGWWMNYFVQDTRSCDKQELMRSPYLCPPYPHGFLLVVRVDRAFSETYRRAIKEHLELLGERVWSHTFILFTFGDWLGDTTIEQYIESEGKAIQWLVEKCGSRYHVFNNKSKGCGFQVTELLGKVEEMVARNKRHNCHYDTDRNLFLQMEQKRKTLENEANAQITNFQKQREALRPLIETVQIPTELRLILVGRRHCGKSSAGNTILGKQEFEVGTQANWVVERKGRVNGKIVSVVKAPGWQSLHMELARWDLEGSTLNAFVSGVLLLVVNCSASFLHKELKAAEAHLGATGNKPWKRTVILFTNGDWLGDTTIEQHIACEGNALRKLVENSGNRYHVLNNKLQPCSQETASNQVVQLLLKIEELMALLKLEDHDNDGMGRMFPNHEVVPGAMVIDNNVPLTTKQNDSSCTEHHMKFSGQCATSSCLVTSEVLDLRCTGSCETAAESFVLVNDGPRAKARTLAVVGRSERFQHSRQAAGKGAKVENFAEWFCPRISQGLMRLISPSGPIAFLLVIPSQQQPDESQTPHEEKEGTVYGRTPEEAKKLLPTSGLLNWGVSGDLQAAIDYFGCESVDELESFIDYYHELILEDSAAVSSAKQSSACSSGNDVSMGKDSLLSSIDQKLSKLDILEPMKKDLLEMKHILESSCKILLELKDNNLPKLG
ncbi:GTPase IMAP family member 8 [Denticeps clupeoides]|uniref:AIG1-type G domain-containing protein n=1 Tax=Denticeps clupeoides TaxID=299321 RepID=A0AAY4AY23_9TELE|nr:GTPase IMAP family member 8-like [Denticeps clupeoides]XP_028810076.1 GTPase IMAP family member 8-like [Denticeps clupeoides]